MEWSHKAAPPADTCMAALSVYKFLPILTVGRESAQLENLHIQVLSRSILNTYCSLLFPHVIEYEARIFSSFDHSFSLSRRISFQNLDRQKYKLMSNME